MKQSPFWQLQAGRRRWFLPLLLLVGLCGPSLVRAANVYWTGAGADNHWSNPNNWVDGTAVQRVPDSNDVVWIGHSDHTPDAHQAIVVDADTLVDQVQFVGTGSRSAALTATNEATLFTVTGLHGINIPASATADLTVNLKVQLTTGTGQRSVSNASGSTEVTIGPEAVFLGDGQFTYFNTGTFRVLSTQPELSDVLRLRSNPTVIADMNGVAIGNGEIQAWGTLLLASDAVSTTSPWIRLRDGNGLDVGIVETSNDVRFVLGQVTTYANADPTRRIQVIESPDGSPGHLTLVVTSLGSADNSPWIGTIANSTVELSTGIPAVPDPDNAGITGGGNLLLKGASAATVYEFGRHMTYTGRTMLETGILSLAASGSLPEGTIVEIGGDAALRVNHERTVGGVSDYNGSAGTLDLNGGALTVHAAQASAFGGSIAGTGGLTKSGPETWSLTAGYTNAAGRTLRVEGGLLAVTGVLSVEDGTFELAGGRITAGSLASENVAWNITLYEDNEDQTLVTVTGNADLTGATLVLELAGEYAPAYGTEYTLLYAGTIFGAQAGGALFQYQDGETFEENGQEYTIRWQDGSGQIILTAIPEPGSLALLLSLGSLLVLRCRRTRKTS